MRKASAVFLCLCLVILFTIDSSAGSRKTDSSLRFLGHVRNRIGKAGPAGELLTRAGADEKRVTVTVKFEHVLSPAEIELYEARGVGFYYIDGEAARTGSIYPVRAAWEAVESLEADREVLRMEGSWSPAVHPCLDLSVPEIQADSSWAYTGDAGFPLTGRGTRVADFDTGIDVFHPSFFFADGDTLNWIDVNENGLFDGETDAVDLNENGIADAGETLDYFDGWLADYAGVFGNTFPYNNGNGYQTYWDWLYNDANDNGYRDYGPSSGFTESDPTFGELLFIALDDNGNGELDTGERVAALGTSKVFAAMTADSLERVRGVDIIMTQDDTNGHGTAVSGILAGGTEGRHKFTGIAPGAEILMGCYFSDIPISYLVPWARSRGADVMLYEFGGYVWHFLDGSSLDEEVISIENETIMQVTPSGNLGRGEKHAITDVGGNGSVTLEINAAVVVTALTTELYSTTLWRTELSDLSFSLETPRGNSLSLTGGGQWIDGFYVWSDKAESVRGTRKMDIYIERGTNGDVLGDWHLTVENNTPDAIEIISNIADNASSWRDGAEFTDYYTDQRNVTWPATSDSSMVNGSYSTRGFEGYGGIGQGRILPGDISAFSGRGERIDGKHLLDICSPGNYDVYTAKTHTDYDGFPVGAYRQFSGTSAAGPHVAAAAALVIQRWPGADMNEVAGQLTAKTQVDGFTGAVYNDTWGYGKLRVLRAISVMTGLEDMEDGTLPPALAIGRNYPNPFNPSTWIPFYLPGSGNARMSIYSVDGRRVRTLVDRYMAAGAHSARWDGKDGRGRAVSSGVYFCVLNQGGNAGSRKLVLMR